MKILIFGASGPLGRAITQAAAAAHRHPGGPPWPPVTLASAIPSARVAVISTGMTRPKVRSRPCSTWMW